MPKWCQTHAKTMPKWSLNDPNVTPDRPKNGPKSPQKWPIFDPFLAYFDPSWPYFAPFWPVFGSKKGSRWWKWVKSHQKPVQRSSKHSSKYIKPLEIHSGYFQAHPLTAHFNRMKRRFHRFFKQNKCFTGERGHVLTQFCIILVNFGRILHIFFFSPIILLNFAVNFPKHH